MFVCTLYTKAQEAIKTVKGFEFILGGVELLAFLVMQAGNSKLFKRSNNQQIIWQIQLLHKTILGYMELESINWEKRVLNEVLDKKCILLSKIDANKYDLSLATILKSVKR